MNVVFRVDASKHMGSGHVMRCKTLAEELRRRGAQIRFICRAHDGNLISDLHKFGFIVDTLPAEDLIESVSDLTYSNEWLVVEPECDAKQTIQTLDNFVVDWLIVDHYRIDSSWENEIRPFVKSILVIDDLADREHDCDILIDQNWFGGSTDTRYTGLVPDHCHLLLGPRYAILPQVYSQISKSLPPRDGSIKRVLIFMGGVDSGNQTFKSLEALCRPELLHLAVDIVIGSSNSNSVHIEKLALTRADTSIYKNLPNLAGLMARADLMLGAGGTTTWERCCLGLPALVVIASQNQKDFTMALAKTGVHLHVGGSSSVTTDDWFSAVCNIMNDLATLKEFSRKSLEITDGLGVNSIMSYLYEYSNLPNYEVGNVNLNRWSSTRYKKDLVIKNKTEDLYIEPEKNEYYLPQSAAFSAYDKYGSFVGELILNQNSDDTIVNLFIKAQFTQLEIRKALLTKMVERMYHELLTVNKKVINLSDVIKLKNKYLCNSEKDLKVVNGGFLRITILSDKESWINEFLELMFLQWFDEGYLVRWVHKPEHIVQGDICFILSCGQLLNSKHLKLNTNNLVVHESALPDGRGWSPLSWQILEGKSSITVTLFEAETEVDSGLIYLQDKIELNGTELVDELRGKQASITIELCRSWINSFPKIIEKARSQEGESSFYKRRMITDSELDVNKSLAEQFDLLRIVDNVRYPAFFSFKNTKYIISIWKDQPHE